MLIEARRIFVRTSTIVDASKPRIENAGNRRMCAGTYLDREFRDQVLKGIYNDVNRRVAPSYGFDLPLVVHHAWRAWWLELCQHLAVLAILGFAFICMTAQAVIVISALTIWYLLRGTAGWARGLPAYYTGRITEGQLKQLQSRGKFLGGWLLGACTTLLAAMVVSWNIGGRVTGAAHAEWLQRAGVTGAGLILAGLAVIITAGTVLRVAWSGQLRRTDPAPARISGRRMQVIADQQHHPVTVHSSFKPFIGSGTVVRSWSFAQRLIHRKALGTEPDQEFDELPFTAAALIDHLKEIISALRTHHEPETRLPGLTVTDHLFVEGTHAEGFRHVLRDHRDGSAIADAIADAIANPSDVARHYLACRVESWGGEVVTSVFVHVSLQGRTLYLEFATYALLPTRAEYHVIDEPGGTGIPALMKSLTKCLVSLPEELLAARRIGHAPIQLWAALRPGKDRTVKTRTRTDIGAYISAREAAAATADETYFQYQDILQHSKIIERRLIATVGDYLKELHVDTSEFWERARAILNSGVINMGSGTVNISDSAIGDQATVTTADSEAARPEDPA
jgi:hypothetical protein